MKQDWLDALSDVEVPPLQDDFAADVDRRLNSHLVVTQTADFVFRFLPFAMLHLAQAFFAFVVFSLTGLYPKQGE